MATYMDLSIMARGFISLWFDIVMIIACIVVFNLIVNKSYALLFPAVGVVAASYLLMQWCVYISKSYDKGFVPTCAPKLFSSMRWTWLFWLGIVLTAVTVYLMLYIAKWRRTHVSSSSLKQGMDNLPSGLCWYQPDGTVILRNRVMERLCMQLTSSELLDGIRFKEQLESQMDDSGVITFSDGSAWSIRTNVIESDEETLNEICAYDITKEYETTRLLEQKHQEAMEANEKLARYSRELAQMITAEEVLAAKVRIHDELGKSLLLTRKYLLRDHTPEDKEKLLYVLRKNNTLMERIREESDKSYLEMILEAASDMGVNLIIDGNMPENESVRDVITTAIHENLTNTIRHAQGDEMRVKLYKEQDKCIVVFTNNGKAPTKPVEERGGLAMLRALVEAAHGKMEIVHKPEYKMTLYFDI